MALNDRDYLISLGFETNVKSLEKELKGAALDKEIKHWADAMRGFDEIASAMGTNLKSLIGDISELTKVQEVYQRMLNGLERNGYQVNRLGGNKARVSGAHTGRAKQSIDFTSNGNIKSVEMFKSTADRAISPELDVQESLRQQSERVYNTMDIAGFDDISKERLKDSVQDIINEYGNISKEKQEEILNNLQKFVKNMKVAYNSNGEAVKEWVTLQVDEYTRLTKSWDIVKSDNLITGQKDLFQRQSGSMNLSYDQSKVQKNAEKEVKDYAKLTTDRSKLLASGLDESDKKITSLANRIEESKRTLSEFGVTADSSTGKLSQSIEDSTKGFIDLSKAIGSANQKIDISGDVNESNISKKNTQEHIELLKQLYSAKRELSRLSINGDDTEAYKAQNRIVEDLVQNEQKYHGVLQDLNKVSEERNKLEKEFQVVQAKNSASKRQKELNEVLKARKELYKEESKLQKLEMSATSRGDLEQQRVHVDKLRREYNNLNEELRESAEVKAADSNYTRKLTSEYNVLAQKVNGSAKSFSEIKERISNAAKNAVIYGGFYKAFNLVENAISDSVQVVRELDTAMTDIQMVTGETDEEARKLLTTYSKMAQELGATTKEVAEGSLEWLRQGKTVEDTNKLLRASTMLSKVGAIEASEATEKLTAVMNGYKLSVEEATDVVSKLVNIDLIAATSSEEIATALQRVSQWDTINLFNCGETLRVSITKSI